MKKKNEVERIYFLTQRVWCCPTPHLQARFPCLSYPWPPWWKEYMENSRNKQLTSFQLHAVLHNMTESCAGLLCPSWVKCSCAVYSTCTWVPQEPSDGQMDCSTALLCPQGPSGSSTLCDKACPSCCLIPQALHLLTSSCKEGGAQHNEIFGDKEKPHSQTFTAVITVIVLLYSQLLSLTSYCA